MCSLNALVTIYEFIMSQKNKQDDDFEIKDALEILSQKDENSKLTVSKLINLICQNIAQLICE